MNDIYEGQFKTDVLWDFDYTNYENTDTVVTYSVEPAEPNVGIMNDIYEYEVILYRNNKPILNITDDLSDVDNAAIYNACKQNVKEVTNGFSEPY